MTAEQVALNTPPYAPDNPPPSLAAADMRRAELGADILDIQTQLGARNKLNVYGERMSDEEYWAWHHRASVAWKARVRETTFLKAWCHQQRMASGAAGTPGSARAHLREAGILAEEPLTVLAALYDICVQVLRDDYPLSATERRAIGLAFRILQAHDRAPAPDGE